MKETNSRTVKPAIYTVHIFTVHGKTFTFKDVTNILVNESAITFDYVAMSDEREKKATFFVANLAGYSRANQLE